MRGPQLQILTLTRTRTLTPTRTLTLTRSAAAALVRVREQAAGSIALSPAEMGDDAVERAVTPPAGWSPRRPFSPPGHGIANLPLPLQTCVMEPKL